MPTARYGELLRHVFIVDCDGAAQVSNPRPVKLPGCGPAAASAAAPAAFRRATAGVASLDMVAAARIRRTVASVSTVWAVVTSTPAPCTATWTEPSCGTRV